MLLLDKPTGITSNAAIQQVKRLFAAAKAGHVGTLDPLASGLLPVCLGEATKFSTRRCSSADKSYDAEVLLGVTTTPAIAKARCSRGSPSTLRGTSSLRCWRRLPGVLAQTPPMYSALKRDGKPLYAYARAGLTVERAPRSITIHGITLLDFAGDRCTINVHCSKGTYIRVLAEDIGAALGCGATLAGLRRMQVGNFGVADAVSLGGTRADDLRRSERTSAARR